MYVLDTNVLSELMKTEPQECVIEWLKKRPSDLLFSTVISEAEILYGIQILPDGARKDRFHKKADQLFGTLFSGQLLGLDRGCAQSYAVIVAARRKVGLPIAPMDALIAAIAHRCGATLVTRNTTDFEACGIVLVNPWIPESPLKEADV